MKVSIVTISFNQGEFLERAIRSIADQRRSGVDLEYIVVDAGSTDSSMSVIRDHSRDIDHLLTGEDEGPADGLNRGFATATGDVFGYVNADDALEPGALSKVVAYFSEPYRDEQAVMGALRVVTEPDGGARVVLPMPFDLRRFAEGRTLTLQQSTFFTRQAFERTPGFNIENRTCWDTELLLEMLLAGARIGRMSEVLATFYVHPRSITGSGQHHIMSEADRRRLIATAQEATGVRDSRTTWLRRLAWRARPVARIRSGYSTIRDSRA